MASALRHEIALGGCTPAPLASYLKALAVLRLVSEQVDPGARGYWSLDTFVLVSSMGEEELQTFLLNDYRPTPIVAPWNGGSGFFTGDQKSGIDAIRACSSARLEAYRDAVTTCEAEVSQRLGLHTKPDDRKHEVLTQCRNVLADDVLAWLDAAYVLTAEAPRYPPLLGTGGNDGRLDFSNNFMQRLCDVISMGSQSGEPTSASRQWLSTALHNVPAPGMLGQKAIGQFAPGGAGGPNASTGFDGASLVNPWDFILMIEGALLFAASTSRRLSGGQSGQLAFPFTVRSSAAGHGSLSVADPGCSRHETWVPLWRRPCSLPELRMLLSEGRAQVSRRVAVDGVDFARAVARLGVDRGITAFERMGYLRRNGLSYLAVPLGRWLVSPKPETELLDEIDPWLTSFARAAGGDRAPASFIRAHQGIERAVMAVCREDTIQRWQQLIVALGAAEAAMAASPKSTAAARLKPLTGLSPRWLDRADDRSPEYRLACSLASMAGSYPVGPLRANMAPLRVRGDGRAWAFDPQMSSASAVWGKGDLAGNLVAVLHRRCLDARRSGMRGLPLDATRPASIADVIGFIEGDLVERKIEDLLWGLNAVRWGAPVDHRPLPSNIKPLELLLPAGYALLKLTHLPWSLPLPWSRESLPIRHDPESLALAAAGRMEAATAVASRRLRASGLTALLERAPTDATLARRIAAAILFPVSRLSAARLVDAIVRPPREP